MRFAEFDFLTSAEKYISLVKDFDATCIFIMFFAEKEIETCKLNPSFWC